MTTDVKSSRAFDVIINNENDIEVKSISSNDNIPFAFQKRDKIPLDDIVEVTAEEEEKGNDNRTSSSFSVSTLSNLPFDERPVPTLYNKMKKEKEEKKAKEKAERAKAERAKKTVSLMDMLSEEKKAQLSWKTSMDDNLGLRPKSVVSRSSAYDRKLNRTSMSIMAEVINSDCFDTDSESEYEEESDLEITETNNEDKDKEKIVSTEENNSLSNEINDNKFSKNKVYPAECIASGIEEIKSNISQVENSSIHTSIVTQEQVNKHLSRQSMSLPKPLENKSTEVPQLTISLVPESESTTPSTEERKLLNYDSTSNLNTTTEKEIKGKKDKKSKKTKSTDDTAMCECIIL